MQPRIYLMTALLLIVSLVVIFRILVRRAYQQHGRLTPFSLLLEYFAIFLWVGYAYANRPYDWPVSHVGPITSVVGWTLFTGGWVGMLAALVRLGVRRSHGLTVTSLHETGVYGLTKNPQVVAFLVAMFGYVLLWPGWRSLGSLILVGILSHLMLRTEEEHLLDVFGADYEEYCRKVSRYVGISRRMRE